MKRATTQKSEENQNSQEPVIPNAFQTKNNNKMKTKNNVQKAILKSMAVIVSFVLISITVDAQDFWKSILENTSFNEIALAMVENNTEANSASNDANTLAAFLEVENEEVLELEDWMTNETFFNANSMYLEVEAEDVLELEKWMTNDSYFSNSAVQIIEEFETELELEDWMLNNELFDTNKELEQPLKLEKWMTSEETWIG